MKTGRFRNPIALAILLIELALAWLSPIRTMLGIALGAVAMANQML